MVKVVANMYVKAENIDKFLELGREVVEKTVRLDTGCIRYELCRDKHDSTHFAMIEDWGSKAALNSHLKSEHFLELIPQMDELCVKKSEVTLFDKVY